MAIPITGGGAGGGGFQLSPGINTSEIDLTNTVGAVSTTTGAIAGVFSWGPVEEPKLINSENNLVAVFGKPSSLNAETWFTAANFAAYGPLYVVRAANTAETLSAIANTGTANIEAHTIKNGDDFINKSSSFETDVHYIAKYPGKLGDSLKISECSTANQYQSSHDLRAISSNTSFNNANSKISATVGSNTITITLANSAALANDTPLPLAQTVANLISVGDMLQIGNSSIGVQYMRVSNAATIVVSNTAGTNSGSAVITVPTDSLYRLSTDYASNTFTRNWEFFNQVDRAPGQSDYVANFGNTAANDEIHVVVVDEDGKFSGNPGTILEVYTGLSRATDAKSNESGSNYYKTVINNQSPWIWAASDVTTAVSNTAVNITNATGTTPATFSLSGGADGGDESSSGINFSALARAYDKFTAAEDIDVSLIMTGKSRGGSSGELLANYIVDNVVEIRKDCMLFVSPEREDVVNVVSGAAVENIVGFRNALRSSSYAVLDSGYKYQYDKYNDVYRYVPLNGDIAGLAARTDSTNDPWFSPAGSTRGLIKNVVKLAYNPSKADRDVLYKNGINPVVTFPGEGTMLYGDKTLLKKASAFDRINVRRLFIVLEKSLSIAAKSAIFEFNDPFTRAQFKNLVEPYLRDVQGRRGIYDFKVVCDETNNTPEVVDSNRFVGDIYIKPARSINYIQLNFVAVRSSVEFSEVAGNF